MTHEELKSKLTKAMGGYPPAVARERWGNFLRNKSTEFTLRYDWIKDPRFYKWLMECPEVDFGEGAETISVWTV